MTIARTENYVWVTWLSKLMAGETQCHWSGWFKTHYTNFEKAPSDFQLATWQMEHNKCLNELVEELKPQTSTIYKENQNYFKVKRHNATIAGKPDLVALGKDGIYTVYDIKTGQQRASDIIQVMIYMACLPYSGNIIYKGKKLKGCVVYNNDRTIIPLESIDETFNKQLGHFLDILDSDDIPSKTPSYPECCYCEITKEDCDEKVEHSADSEENNDLPV
jgi:NADH:ubiquinone oxidoreductase subunit